MTTLSVLDLATVGSGSDPAAALRDTTRLALAAEELGYRRFWVAEHHSMPAVASSSPPVLIAHLAARTQTIRIGSGGVMLPNHSPLVVAEQFGTLEALHPGRIDLGIGRAPGTDPATTRALRRSADLGADTFPDDVVELIQYLEDRPGPARHPMANPGRGYLPEVWLLGSSLFSAQLAGLLGLPFAFAYHFSPGPLDAALSAYRSVFQPGLIETPHVMVAVSALCAPTVDEAVWLAGSTALSTVQLRTNRLGPMPSPEEAAAYRYSDMERALVEQTLATHVIGDPDTVADGLAALAARTGADELIISTRVHSYEARRRSLELIAGIRGDASNGAPGREAFAGCRPAS
jgi:luciferase family oxidoreductase group 1